MSNLAYTYILGNKPGERIGIVKYKESGFYATTLDNPGNDMEGVKETVADLNKRLGIPEDVADSMRYASMFGWDKPVAEAAHRFLVWFREGFFCSAQCAALC